LINPVDKVVELANGSSLPPEIMSSKVQVEPLFGVEDFIIFAKEQCFGREVDDVPKAANPSLLPFKIKDVSQCCYRRIVILRVVKREIPDFVLNLE
jgi:hypothetical protein